jgi:hypothetical protein
MAVRSVWGNMGYMEDSGWGRGVVERVRGAQEVPWSAKNRGVSCCMHFSIDSQFGDIDPFLLLPSTEGQWRGLLLQYNLTRGVWRCWMDHCDGLRVCL